MFVSNFIIELELISLHIVKWFELFLSNIDNSNQYLSFVCLKFKWFLVLLFNISNSIYQVFLSNTNNLYTVVWFQITNNNNPW